MGKRVFFFSLTVLMALNIVLGSNAAVYTSSQPTIHPNETVNSPNLRLVPSTLYPTIQSALSSIIDNTTIQIANGTYQENILFDQSFITSGPLYRYNVTIEGKGPGATIIDGSLALCAFQYLSITGLTVTGTFKLGDTHSPPGAVTNSKVTNVEARQATTIGGPANTLLNCTLNGVTLTGGDGRREWVSSDTKIDRSAITEGVKIKSGSYSNTNKQ